jgi:hypothetical protein
MTDMKLPNATNYKSIGIIILASCVWGVFVLGPKPLNIFDTSWLWHDLAQVYLAWAQYNSDPNAHWLMSSRLSYPIEMNFALFDPMPIFLLTIGKLSPLFPDRTQFFGIYFLICLVLQGLLGYLILKKIISDYRIPIHQKEIYCLIGSIFFIIAPFTFYRFQQHIALASHWIILLSILAILCTRSSKLLQWILINCAVVLLATGINPYLTLMVLISQSCIVICDLHRTSFIQTACRFFAIAIVTVVGFKIFGFLSASGVRDFGYGAFSMNMLGPFSSNGWATLLPINVPDPTEGQAWEGFNYQGLGILILLGISAYFGIRRKPNERGSFSFPYKAALIIVLISYLLALSTTITFSSIVFKPYVPSIVIHILSAFRASGRLFWVGGYWLIIIGIITLPLFLNFKGATYLLSALLFIQILDVSGVGFAIRNKISTIQRTAIQSEAITLNPERYDELVVLPPWQCNTEKTAGGGNNYEYLGFFAADHKISTNNFYAARILPEQTAFHCLGNDPSPQINSKKLYIISKEYYLKIKANIINALKCAYNSEHSFYVCSSQNP